MDTSIQEKNTYKLFRLSLLLKASGSLLEVIAGLLLFVVPVSSLANLAVQFAQAELIDDPDDFIASHLLPVASYFSVASLDFFAIYLFARGLIKLIPVVALLYNKRWAYPVSLGILGLFVLYQIYQIATAHSGLRLILIGLTLFDFIVIYFILQEYRIVRRRSDKSAA